MKLAIEFIKKNYIALLIALFFLICYFLLGSIRHSHYLSGYDVSIMDQAVWKYSVFKTPNATLLSYSGYPIYFDHLEIIFILISPIYWLFKSVDSLIFLQSLSVAMGGLAVFFLSQKYKIKIYLGWSILVSYYLFFGNQFAVWSDVHSIVFAVGFLSWFIYFSYEKKIKLSLLFFTLAILCKEDVSLLTFVISITIFITNRNKTMLITALLSLLYLVGVFLLYYPYVVPGGYRYSNPNGLFYDINLNHLLDTPGKKNALFYSFASFGFMPFLTPLLLLPFAADILHYFVLANSTVSNAQDIFQHYRSATALLLTWPMVIAFSKFKKFNNKYTAIYIIVCALAVQYVLHLPLSYFTKEWFWKKPEGVSDIEKILKFIPDDVAIATQNNIAPHISQRDFIYILFPEKKSFLKNSPCGKSDCDWFRIGGSASYLLIDFGTDWNILHYLTTRQEFSQGIKNLELTNTVKLTKKLGTARLYKIQKNF